MVEVYTVDGHHFVVTRLPKVPNAAIHHLAYVERLRCAELSTSACIDYSVVVRVLEVALIRHMNRLSLVCIEVERDVVAHVADCSIVLRLLVDLLLDGVASLAALRLC